MSVRTLDFCVIFWGVLFLGFLKMRRGGPAMSAGGVVADHPGQRAARPCTPRARWSRDQPPSSMPWTVVLGLGLNMTKIA